MRYQIPEDEQERLDQLNEWFTQILCKDDYFNDEKWLPIRLNLAKWRDKKYTYRQEFLSDPNSFDLKEQALVYKIYNYLGEVMLLDAKMREAAHRQKFDLAILYQDLTKLAKQELENIHTETLPTIRFFKIENEGLVLKHIENYFINQDIKERLRK
jgi:hypothetical protein